MTAQRRFASTSQKRTRSRSEEHTSELQSRSDLVCRLLLENKNAARISAGRRATRSCAARKRAAGTGHRSLTHRPRPRCLAMPRARQQVLVFFFNDTATTEIYTLSLHDALPI